jgi:CDP-4-dehydro-6-deoxyglucose reductase, E1
MKKYSLSSSTWGPQEEKIIQKIIKSGKFTMGKYVQQFEKNFSSYIGKNYSVMVNSGSSANLLGLSSFLYTKFNPLKKGDEVIVSDLAWSTTYAPLQQLGLKLKILDIDLSSLNINIQHLEKAITKKTKLIVAVNILGIPCDLETIKAICKKKNILFFEDNCESLGASIKNKKTGSFGDISSHSFFFSHHICTMEGGMCSTDSYELYCIMKSLRAHGWTRDLPKNNPLIKKPKNSFYEAYNFLMPGYNLRPVEIQGAIGIEQLKKVDNLVKKRRKNLKLFEKYFKQSKNFLIPYTNYYSSSFAFPLIIKNKSIVFKIKILKLLKKNKIDFRLIAGGSFVKQTYSKYFNFSFYKKIKNSILVHDRGFIIGNSGSDLSLQIRHLYKVLKNYI